MKPDSDGQPKCGNKNSELGVRVPTDVQPDASELVPPCGGDGKPQGMSVHENVYEIALGYRSVVHGGSNKKNREFAIDSSDLGELLLYRWEPGRRNTHGVVGVRSAMPLVEYQKALCQTREGWRSA